MPTGSAPAVSETGDESANPAGVCDGAHARTPGDMGERPEADEYRQRLLANQDAKRVKPAIVQEAAQGVLAGLGLCAAGVVPVTFGIGAGFQADPGQAQRLRGGALSPRSCTAPQAQPANPPLPASLAPGRTDSQTSRAQRGNLLLSTAIQHTQEDPARQPERPEAPRTASRSYRPGKSKHRLTPTRRGQLLRSGRPGTSGTAASPWRSRRRGSPATASRSTASAPPRSPSTPRADSRCSRRRR
jgi:hypothetical protein